MPRAISPTERADWSWNMADPEESTSRLTPDVELVHSRGYKPRLDGVWIPRYRISRARARQTCSPMKTPSSQSCVIDNVPRAVKDHSVPDQGSGVGVARKAELLADPTMSLASLTPLATVQWAPEKSIAVKTPFVFRKPWMLQALSVNLPMMSPALGDAPSSADVALGHRPEKKNHGYSESYVRQTGHRIRQSTRSCCCQRLGYLL